MTILLFGAVLGMAGLWILIIHAFSYKMKVWFCRRQWAFLMFHIPVMYFMSYIGGEGLIFGLASLIGGIIGQFWLALWGLRQGLTFAGRKTPRFKEPRKKFRTPIRYKLDLWLTSKFLKLFG